MAPEELDLLLSLAAGVRRYSPPSQIHRLTYTPTVNTLCAPLATLDMAFQNRSRIPHYDVCAFPGSDPVELQFRRALVATQRANTWLYEDVARRSAAQETPLTFNDDDGYTADTEAEGTSHHPRRRVLIS